MTQTTLATIVDGVIALAVIAAASVLLVLDKIDAPTALALFGVAVTLIGGSAKALLALHIPAPAQRSAASQQTAPPVQAT